MYLYNTSYDFKAINFERVENSWERSSQSKVRNVTSNWSFFMEIGSKKTIGKNFLAGDRRKSNEHLVP